MRFRHVVVWIAGIVLSLSVLGIACRERPSAGDARDQRTERVFPAGIQLQDLEGNPATLGPYADRVVLVNFWASWCAPCKEEIPDLQKLYDDWKDDGLTVVGISIDADREDAQKFAESHHVTYPMFWDGDNGPVNRAFGNIIVLPTTFIFDRSGRQVKKIVGPRTYDEFLEILRPLLEEQPKSGGA